MGRFWPQSPVDLDRPFGDQRTLCPAAHRSTGQPRLAGARPPGSFTDIVYNLDRWWMMKISRFRSFTYMLPQLWRALFTRPITVRYPFVPLALPPHFRGRIVVDAKQCRGCGLCARDCPASALVLERENRDVYRLVHFPDRCAYCGQCETSCTFGAIKQTNEFVPATSKRQTLVEIMVEAGTEHPSDVLSPPGTKHSRDQTDGDIAAECPTTD